MLGKPWCCLPVWTGAFLRGEKNTVVALLNTQNNIKHVLLSPSCTHSQDKTWPGSAHGGSAKCAYRLISLWKYSPAERLHHKKMKYRSNTSNNLLLKEQRTGMMQDNINWLVGFKPIKLQMNFLSPWDLIWIIQFWSIFINYLVVLF